MEKEPPRVQTGSGTH